MEGAKVYIPDSDQVWLPAAVVSVENQVVQVVIEEASNGSSSSDSSEVGGTVSPHETLGSVIGTTRKVDLKNSATQQLITASNRSTASSEEIMLPLQNPNRHAHGVEDMITLDYLHEGAILYNLRQRFFHHYPYTFTGKTCIAINPYQWLNLYSTSIMSNYHSGRVPGQSPHIYAISMDAYLNMRQHGRNQSLLVSGESGAGKTESSKILMGHIAKLSVQDTSDAGSSNDGVIQRIIESNPLLESFGNAKTIRNDNSSRFGKFTELQFNAHGGLIGARSRTYLLEKSRVIQQNPGERNFHIFYQLLAAAKDGFPHLKLDKTEFRYVIADEADIHDLMLKQFQRTVDALNVVGISSVDQEDMMNILGAILHLGQVQFCAPGGDVDKSQLVDTAEFQISTDLLGVRMEDLELALCSRNVVVGREVYLSPMTVEKANESRDALSKALYSKLFNWLVDKINNVIGVPETKVTNFIGILDIFGFEHFEENSFEQLCINYANEKLQQKFVRDVLKTVQAEYEEEQISWSHVVFSDNQDVLDAVEGKLGVLALLNEESMLATGTDEAFANKLGTVMAKSQIVQTPRLNHAAFTIHHYAATVTYQTFGFLDKHRDTLLPGIASTMSSATCAMVQALFKPSSSAHHLMMTQDKKTHHIQRKKNTTSNHQKSLNTVGMQFKVSLATLMDKVNETDAHYVRCIKPNGLKSAHAFDHGSVVDQLRCAGVIEAIRVSRSAYPNQMAHRDLLLKYAVLLPGGASAHMSAYRYVADTKSAAEVMLRTLFRSEEEDVVVNDVQVGLTKVYFGLGVLESLETRRAEALRDNATTIQKSIKGYVLRQWYIRSRVSAILVQTLVRGTLTRRRYIRARVGVIRLQAQLRGRRGRALAQVLKQHRSVSKIQATCKAYLERREYRRKRSAVIDIQSWARMTLARKMFSTRLRAHKKQQALGTQVARLQTKLGTSPAKPNHAHHHSNNALNANNNNNALNVSSLCNSLSRPSGTSDTIFNESAEVLGVLQEENLRLLAQIELLKDDTVALKSENRKLRDWQKSKEVDERVKGLAQRDQASKDLAYLLALESEFEKMRTFVCTMFHLPQDTGADFATSSNNTNSNTSSTASTVESSSSSLASPVVLLPPKSPTGPPPAEERPLVEGNVVGQAQREDARQLLSRVSTRLARARNKSGRASTRRCKDFWEEIRNFPPALQYELGSVPWKRLLTDWAQGNPKKLDYMTRWLKNVLGRGPIENGPFPMGVELKSVTPMMLDGFLQLIIPKLDERPDINVHVHTKEFIGTSMRITLSMKETKTTRRRQSSSSSQNNDPPSMRVSHVIRSPEFLPPPPPPPGAH